MNEVTAETPRVISIQTGKVSALLVRRGPDDDVTVMSGIRKTPVSSIAQPTPVSVARLGLAGDEQSDLSVHGGLDKAVYAYPSEHYAFWQKHLRRDTVLVAGALGENLTTVGLLESDLWIGDELRIADCVLTVESPRRPCYKLNALLNCTTAAKAMITHQLSGWYLSVNQPGTLRAGDVIQVTPGPRRVSLAERQTQITRPVDLL